MRKQDFKKEATSRHYKFLKLVRAFTLDLAALLNSGTHDGTIMLHSVKLGHVNTSKTWLVNGGNDTASPKTNSATNPEVVKLSVLKLPLTQGLWPWLLCH